LVSVEELEYMRKFLSSPLGKTPPRIQGAQMGGNVQSGKKTSNSLHTIKRKEPAISRMNTKWVVVAGLTLAIGAGVGFGSLFTSRNFHANASTNAASGKENFYSFTARDIAHKEVSMSQYKGKVVLVVNVASE